MSFTGTASPLGPSPATVLVNDYIQRKVLAKIGFKFDPNELSQFEALYLVQIHQKFTQLENDRMEMDMKKAKTRTKRG